MRTISIAVGIVAVVAAAGAAVAGVKTPQAVVINNGIRTAGGALGTARNSTDTNQFIGCEVTIVTAGGPAVFCFATNAKGAGASCTSGSAAMASAVQNIQPDSNITFAWDSNSNCVSLTVSTASQWEPKK
jgi:hypothetical protein